MCNRSMSCSSWTTVLRSIEEAQTSAAIADPAETDGVENAVSNGGRTGAAAHSKSFGAENASVARPAAAAAASDKLSSLRVRAPLTPRTNRIRIRNVQ